MILQCTIYFNLEDFDPTCIESDITNELDKVNIWLKLNKLSLTFILPSIEIN